VFLDAGGIIPGVGGPPIFFGGGATTTKALVFTGSAPITVFGTDEDFVNVTSISGTSKLTITGALNSDRGFLDSNGLLAENTVITSISGGAGSFFDLSNLNAAEAMAMTTINGGGGGTAVFSNEALTGLTSNLALSGISVIGDGGFFGLGHDPAGTIDFSHLPGATELKFYHGLTFTPGGLVVNNTPGTFTIDHHDESFHGNDVAINAASPTTVGNTITIGLGSTATGDTVHELTGNYTVTGYDNYNIIVRAGTGHLFDGDPTFFAIDSFTGTPAPTSTVNLTLSGPGSLVWGDVFDVSDASSFTNHQVGNPSIELFGGNIIDALNGFLDIGIFDAQSLIGSATSGGIYMHAPGTFLGGNFTVTASPNPGATFADGNPLYQVLQGSLGKLDFGNTNGNDGFDDGATATNTFLTGGHDAGDALFTTGGTTTVTLHNTQGGDNVLFDQFTENNDLSIFTNFDGTGQLIFVNEDAVSITEQNGDFNEEGIHATTINNFVVSGANADIVSFSPDSWGDGSIANKFGDTYLGLVDGALNNIEGSGNEETFAVMFDVKQAGITINSDTNVVVYEVDSFAGGLKALENALGTSGGDFKFFNGASGHNTFDFLFVYNNGNGGVNISDIQFEGDFGANDTQFLNIVGAHNLVTLTNITGGAGSLFSEYLAHHSNIFFNT
jgi:hypothetical protein